LRDADVFVEEAGAAPAEAGALAGDAEVLAGEAADEEIDRFIPVALPLPHVRPAGNVWPSSAKDALAEWIILDLADDSMPRAFEAEVEASDAGKEREYMHC
jgi:hypothetical protein